jgi:NitT/TauT family transport system substrate-binding protein
MFQLHRTRLAQLAISGHLPSAFGLREYVEASGLMSYGASLTDIWRRPASYVDKILKGAKLGELPVEQPTKFELVINMKTAKVLGLTIPQSLLTRPPSLAVEGFMSERCVSWSRRAFVGGLTLAGAGFLRRPEHAAAEPPPETTTLRLALSPAVCFAPQFVAKELLRSEGFTDVQYVRAEGGPYRALAEHRADVNIGLAGQFIIRIDAGDPILILAGTHVGCFELFATPDVLSVKDLRGKTVAVPSMESSHHIVVIMLVAYVGLNPQKDLTFVTPSTDEAIRLLAEGRIHAMMGFPPEPQRLRALKIGHPSGI